MFQAHVHVTKDGQAVVVLLKCRVQMIVQIVGSALMGDLSVILGTLSVVEIVCCDQLWKLHVVLSCATTSKTHEQSSKNEETSKNP